MTCPECGQAARVLETRPMIAGLRRRRGCANGHRFTTHEVITDGNARLRDRAAIVPIARLRELRAWLEELIGGHARDAEDGVPPG